MVSIETIVFNGDGHWNYVQKFEVHREFWLDRERVDTDLKEGTIFKRVVKILYKSKKNKTLFV